jgi:hypothetical protein
VEFNGTRQLVLKDLRAIARHPDFDVNAVLRHRVTADVALIKLAAPLKISPAPLMPAGARSPPAIASSSPATALRFAAMARAAAQYARRPSSPPDSLEHCK